MTGAERGHLCPRVEYEMTRGNGCPRSDMKLSPTEIFRGKKIFFIGGTGWSGDTLVPNECPFGGRKNISPEEPAMGTRVSPLR